MVGAINLQETALGTALSELRKPRLAFRDFVSLGAALEQLDSTQVSTLLDHLERGDRRRHDDRLSWLFVWWFKRDPASAHAWIRPRLDALLQDGSAGHLFESSPRASVVLAWAKADPEAALDYARQHARSGLATALLRKVMGTWHARDLRERLALVFEFPDGLARAKALYELHCEWAAREPAAALASANSLEPGSDRDKTLGEILTAWANRDVAGAFAQYRALGLKDTAALSKMLAKNAAKDPAQALERLQQLDAAEAARCAPRIVEEWARKDPAAALNWAVANGVSLAGSEYVLDRVEHSGLGRSQSWSSEAISPLGTAMKEQPVATLAWLRGLPAGAERDRITEIAIHASRDREQALALFSTLPAEGAARAAGRVMALFRDDVEAGRDWAMSLPAGPARMQAWKSLGALTGKTFDLPPGTDRDAMLSGGLYRIGMIPPPAERLAPLLEISDPVLRRDTIDDLMESSVRMIYWEDAARAALDQADIPEDWKRRWRKPVAPAP